MTALSYFRVDGAVRHWRLVSVLCAAAASGFAFALVPATVLGADYVIQISVDGLRPSYLQTQIDLGLAPNFKKLQEEGAWTNNARTDYTHTNTLPNHTSMLTGRPVSLPSGMPAMTQHGYTENDTPPVTETLHNFTNPDWYKASTFDVVDDAGMTTALYASKGKFVIYDQSYNAMTGPLLTPDGQDEIDTFFAPENTLTMQNSLLAQLSSNPADYTFVHYADPDDAGHNDDWGSPQYMASITTVDAYLGQLISQVQSSPPLKNHTSIILTSDHGGTGSGHGDANNPANYTVPFYVWGTGVQHGSLYDMNLATRTDPGTSRPAYTVAGQPIRNGDSGNLALDLLGLGPIPGSMINSAQNLRVTHTSDYYPGDFNFDNRVNAGDYVKWRKNLGINYTQSDFNVWRSRFGQVDSGAGSGSGNGARGLQNDGLFHPIAPVVGREPVNVAPVQDPILNIPIGQLTDTGGGRNSAPKPVPNVAQILPSRNVYAPLNSTDSPLGPIMSSSPMDSHDGHAIGVPEPSNLALLLSSIIVWIAGRKRSIGPFNRKSAGLRD